MTLWNNKLDCFYLETFKASLTLFGSKQGSFGEGEGSIELTSLFYLLKIS
jgi:hypothetical protein